MELREVELPSEEKQPIPPVLKIVASLIAIACIVFIVIVVQNFEPPDNSLEIQEAMDAQREPDGEDDHGSLRFVEDEPGRRSPTMKALDVDGAIESKPVLGIVDGDVAHAYVLHYTDRKSGLLVSTKLGDRPVAISFNYLTKKARGFTSSDGAGELIDLKYGGWQHDKTMVLMLDDVRYKQFSEKIPLGDFPVELTTLDLWYEQHPTTLVNEDEEASDMSL